MKYMKTLAALSLLLSSMGCSSIKDQIRAGIEAGLPEVKAAASEVLDNVVANAAAAGSEAGTKAAAAYIASGVEADDNLTPEEKTDITTALYGAGGATLASLLAALKLWGSLRARKAALSLVTKAVDAVPDEIGDVVKAQVAALGGNSPAIKSAISEAKA